MAIDAVSGSSGLVGEVSTVEVAIAHKLQEPAEERSVVQLRTGVQAPQVILLNAAISLRGSEQVPVLEPHMNKAGDSNAAHASGQLLPGGLKNASQIVSLRSLQSTQGSELGGMTNKLVERPHAEQTRSEMCRSIHALALRRLEEWKNAPAGAAKEQAWNVLQKQVELLANTCSEYDYLIQDIRQRIADERTAQERQGDGNNSWLQKLGELLMYLIPKAPEGGGGGLPVPLF